MITNKPFIFYNFFGFIIKIVRKKFRERAAATLPLQQIDVVHGTCGDVSFFSTVEPFCVKWPQHHLPATLVTIIVIFLPLPGNAGCQLQCNQSVPCGHVVFCSPLALLPLVAAMGFSDFHYCVYVNCDGSNFVYYRVHRKHTTW